MEPLRSMCYIDSGTLIGYGTVYKMKYVCLFAFVLFELEICCEWHGFRSKLFQGREQRDGPRTAQLFLKL